MPKCRLGEVKIVFVGHFLAANNISAREIRENYLQRQRDAQAEQEREAEQEHEANTEPNEESTAEPKENEPEENDSEKTPVRKRKVAIRVSGKKVQRKTTKGKAKKKPRISSDDDSFDESDLGWFSPKPTKKKPLPGQFENCEVCEKRFTVTAYSKTGPNGGLICNPCGKELAGNDAALKKKTPKVSAAAKRRRTLQSERLDGIIRRGSKPLVQLCIETVLKYHDSIESFESIPDHLIHRICRLFCKHRVLNSQTLPLFIRGDLTVIEVFDCSYLKTEDYNQLFGSAQRLQKLTLHNAYQFKDQNVACMIEKLKDLVDLRLYAPNLVTQDMWGQLFSALGARFKTLKLKWMDDTFQDAQVENMAKCCPNLTRLKLGDLSHLGPASIDALCKLRKLEHLSLDFRKGMDNEHLVGLVKKVGAKLQTLSLRNFTDIDADVLTAIHSTCHSLTKLRLTACDRATDSAWAALFDPSWTNPPLRRLHLSSVRDVDNQQPDGPADAPVGIAAEAFSAILRHSADGLEVLDLASCRHVPLDTLLAALVPDALPADMDGDTGEDVVLAPPVLLPRLRMADLSFVQNVDDVVLAGLFRAAPRLERVALFGCFGVTSDAVVPRGVVVIGAPSLETEGMEMYGGADRENPVSFMEAVDAEMKEMDDMYPTVNGALVVEDSDLEMEL